MNTIKLENKGNCKIIAHRGLSGLERENTAAAFVAAGNRSYFGIETDVRPTVDGRFVLMHDGDTSRCGIDKIIPEQTTFETLMALRLLDMDGTRGRNDLRIPELCDYLRICKRYEKVGVLEFKGPYTVEMMEKIVEIVEAEYEIEKMIFISFNFQNLVNLREVCPKSRCQFLTGEIITDELIEKLKEHKFDIDACHLCYKEESIVRRLQDEGIEVNVWTVDDKEIAERLISWGVDYITTDILE